MSTVCVLVHVMCTTYYTYHTVWYVVRVIYSPLASLNTSFSFFPGRTMLIRPTFTLASWKKQFAGAQTSHAIAGTQQDGAPTVIALTQLFFLAKQNKQKSQSTHKTQNNNNPHPNPSLPLPASKNKKFFCFLCSSSLKLCTQSK